MAGKLPWFPFLVDEWETDPRVKVMGPVARSHYLILLIMQWREGYIPESRKTLKRLLVLPLDPLVSSLQVPLTARSERDDYLVDEDAVLDQVLLCFHPDGNGNLVNKKMQEIRNKQLALHSAKSKGGKERIRSPSGVLQDSSKTPGQIEIEIESKKEPKPLEPLNRQETAMIVAGQCQLSGRHFIKAIEDQFAAYSPGNPLKIAAERMIAAMLRFKELGGKEVYLWLCEGGWTRDESTWKLPGRTGSKQQERARHNYESLVRSSAAFDAAGTVPDSAEREGGTGRPSEPRVLEGVRKATSGSD